MGLLALKLQNPKCQSMIQFDFLEGNLYSDGGCAQFDAEVTNVDSTKPFQEAESIEVITENGKSISMADFPQAKSCMSVPNFKYIFEDGEEVKKEYGMKIEFSIPDPATQTTTALLGVEPEPLRVEIEKGDGADLGNVILKLKLKSDGETKEVSVNLGKVDSSRIIRVVVNWDATAERGAASKNLKISFMDDGRIIKRVFDMQGKITRALWNNEYFNMGCADTYPFQLGTFHFDYEKEFEDDDVKKFLNFL